MNDEQLAERRKQIPVHCAACAAIFPGTTILHNGICEDCVKLTHGPNQRLIAKLQDQERQVERLREALAACWSALVAHTPDRPDPLDALSIKVYDALGREFPDG